MVKRRIFTDIEALRIIQNKECDALTVFRQDYSSSEASSSESELEGISDIDSVDSYSSDDSSVNIVLDTPQKKKKFYTKCLYKNLLTSKNTCTKEILWKTPNFSSCSKSNAALHFLLLYNPISCNCAIIHVIHL